MIQIDEDFGLDNSYFEADRKWGIPFKSARLLVLRSDESEAVRRNFTSINLIFYILQEAAEW